jgi:hypothetical protein
MWNQDAEDALRIFVGQTTSAFKERYKMPAGGKLQATGFQGSKAAPTKATNSWDVAYPLAEYGAALEYNDTALAYLTLPEYENDLMSVFNANNNTLFYLVLKAIFTNVNVTYQDDIHGSLTLVPLANNDGTTYPPVFGSETEAQENFYLAPTYVENQISNTNNPFITARDLLEPHYGFPQGGLPIVSLINTSTVKYARALAGFDEVPYWNVDPAITVTLAKMAAIGETDSRRPVNSRVVGVTDGVTLIEWPRMPSGYSITFHLMAPPPLKRRRDPEDTRLEPGLRMVAQDLDYPFRNLQWIHRMGFGVANRLGAVVTDLVTGTGTYTIPTLYQ